jgi:hypothetical protein
MPPRDNQFTPAEKLIESQSCSGRGACGFVLTVYPEVALFLVREGLATIRPELKKRTVESRRTSNDLSVRCNLLGFVPKGEGKMAQLVQENEEQSVLYEF